MFLCLGKEWQLCAELENSLQEFTCRLCETRSPIKTENDLRYQLFQARKGEVESGQLPPSTDCLSLHTMRANYQSGIWQSSLQASPDTPNPSGHGWVKDQACNLIIKWMNGKPAPDGILYCVHTQCSFKPNSGIRTPEFGFDISH